VLGVVSCASASLFAACGLGSSGSGPDDAGSPPLDAVADVTLDESHPFDAGRETGDDAGSDTGSDAGSDSTADACPPPDPGNADTVVATPAGTIKLDGTLDDWVCPSFHALTLQNAAFAYVRGKLVSPADAGTFPLSASVAFAWDSKNLYLAYEVQDTSIDGNDTVNSYTNDSVEIYVSGDSNPNGDYTSVDHQYVADHNLLVVDYADGTFVGKSPAAVKAAITVQNGSGYIMEVSVDFSALGVTPTAGSSYRFDYGVNDNAGSSQTYALVWHGAALESCTSCTNCCCNFASGDFPFCDTTEFGYVKLSP